MFVEILEVTGASSSHSLPGAGTVFASRTDGTVHLASYGVGSTLTGIVLGGVSVIWAGIGCWTLHTLCLPWATQIAFKELHQIHVVVYLF